MALYEVKSGGLVAVAPTSFAAEGIRERGDIQRLLRELYADYPLLYLTGPDERDVNLTISQINTHKIRGASTVIIAEESAALRGAAPAMRAASTGAAPESLPRSSVAPSAGPRRPWIARPWARPWRKACSGSVIAIDVAMTAEPEPY